MRSVCIKRNGCVPSGLLCEYQVSVIKQTLLHACAGSYLHALLPRDPEVAAGQEASDGVPAQVVDPALLMKLPHDGVDPREASLTLT